MLTLTYLFGGLGRVDLDLGGGTARFLFDDERFGGRAARRADRRCCLGYCNNTTLTFKY